MNRRELLRSSAGLAAAGVLGSPSLSLHALIPPGEDSALARRLATDPRRPQYHLLPARNWMNDPNGPIYWNGQYHMFYQYNPDAPVWGDMHWAHAVSPDIVHWKHLPIALAPTPGGADAAGCFSGTAVNDHGVVTAIYTGVVSSPENEATIADGVNSFRETQCLAYSKDSELLHWTKVPQPVIAAPPPGLKVTGFRDPSPWRKGDGWYMTVGSGVRHQGGAVLLYRSGDLRHWDYQHFLTSGGGNGRQARNPVASGDMWECPDFFPLGNKHVLIYSSAGKVFWQSGVLDEREMRFHAEQEGVVDYGAYYAAKSQLDEHGNRIIWGWIPETRPVTEYRAAGWAGMMSLPRVLRLRHDGQLNIEVDSAVDRLRLQESRYLPGQDVDTQLNKLLISKSTGELLGRFARGGRHFTVSLTGRLPHGEMTAPMVAIEYDPALPGQVLADGTPIPVAGPHTQPLEIHIYMDGSVAEVMLQGTAAYTKRFYYAGDVAPDVRLKVAGPHGTVQSLSVWQIKPISPDRLTT